MRNSRKHIGLMMAIALFAATCFAPSAFASDDADTHSIPMLMVVAEFDGGDNPDAAVFYEDGYDWTAALFGEGDSPATYYRDMSGGAFTFLPARETSQGGVGGNTNAFDHADDGIVHVTLHRPHGVWGAVNVDRTVTQDFAQFVMEALDAAAAYVDFPSFDQDGDGRLSEQELAICICVAGYEASSVVDYERDDIPLMWSHSGLLSIMGSDAHTADGLRFDTYIAISERYWIDSDPLEVYEQEPLGVVYHELGHALGLPDLYAVTITEGPWQDYKVGATSLMDAGGWQYVDDGDYSHNVPTALDAWSRYVLGWTRPTIVTHSGDYAVSSQLSDAGYHALLIPTNDPKEYFLVENRQAEGHDISLVDELGAGVVIWHVDNGMFERYYDANQVNDVDHRPGIMQQASNGEGIELLLYADADAPEACTPSGITVQPMSGPARDMTVHVDLGDRVSAHDALHVLDDAARNRLDMTPDSLLNRIAFVLGSAAK